MRKLLLILIPALVLALLFVVWQQSASWQYIVQGESGELLYVASFSGFADEWEQAPGRNSAEILDDKLIISLGVEDAGIYAPAKPYFDNFDVTVTASTIDGPLDNGFGLIFREQDRDNHYVFLISADGYYRVERVQDGQREELSTWIDTPIINQGLGAENTIRVLAQGDRLQFFINNEQMPLCPADEGSVSTYSLGECLSGELIDTLVDDTFVYGRVGLGAVSFTIPDVQVSFDNLIVYGASSE